jgi:hypothetical protein
VARHDRRRTSPNRAVNDLFRMAIAFAVGMISMIVARHWPEHAWWLGWAGGVVAGVIIKTAHRIPA